MLVAFLVMLREGIEAALIVGIIAGYLVQTGRRAWIPAVWLGVLLAVAASLLVGAGLQLVSAEFPQRAAGAVRGHRRSSGRGRAHLHGVLDAQGRALDQERAAPVSIDAALAGSSQHGLALIGMVFLAVAREGLESVFFLLAIFQQSPDALAPLGALLGILVACVARLRHLCRQRADRPAPLLPLDGRGHPRGRRRHSRRLGARAARGRPVESPAGHGLRPQRRAAGGQRRRHPALRPVRLFRPAGRRRGDRLSAVPRRHALPVPRRSARDSADLPTPRPTQAEPGMSAVAESAAAADGAGTGRVGAARRAGGRRLLLRVRRDAEPLDRSRRG